jgi:prepilin-type N-terminal cleavage/methylation domain-containing protein
MRKKAFTLIEVIIVVTILGILAAIVLPMFQSNVAQAKESASKSNLGTMRAQIELYKLHHSGFPPGYVNGGATTIGLLELQFTGTTAVTGLASPSTIPVDPFLYGPYLKKIPKNPYNKLSTINYVAEAAEFSAVVDGTSSGWLYKKETGEIVINWTGIDSKGAAYCDY